MGTESSSDMTRRSFMGMATAALGTSLPGQAQEKGHRAPDVILVVTDQHTGRALGAHGCKDVQTPVMDRLVQEGVSYLYSYCADPSCSPARASLFTGRASGETGVVLNRLSLRPDIPCLGQWMKSHGRSRPSYMGKWHIVGRSVHREYDWIHSGSYMGGIADGVSARVTGELIQSWSGDEPRVLVISLLNPHDICSWLSLQARSRKSLDFPGMPEELPPLPPNWETRHPEASLFQNQKRKSARTPMSAEVIQLYRWWYYRQVEQLDTCLGTIVQALERSSRPFVMLMTSDHGDSIGEHGLRFKQSLYETSARVPLIAWGPGTVAPQGVDRSTLASGMDVFPTILDIQGLETPAALPGRSLWASLRGGRPPEPRPVFSQSLVDGFMVRSGDFKLIGYQEDVPLLFNLKSDPWELRNLADQRRMRRTVQRLQELWIDWKESLDRSEISVQGFDAAMNAFKRGRKNPQIEDKE